MNRITLLAAAALAAGLAATGLGVANAVSTIPPGTLHGCITGTTRTLEHVYANPSSGTTCEEQSGLVAQRGRQGPAADHRPARAGYNRRIEHRQKFGAGPVPGR